MRKRILTFLKGSIKFFWIKRIKKTRKQVAVCGGGIKAILRIATAIQKT